VIYSAGMQWLALDITHSDAGASGHTHDGKHLDAAVLRALADCSRVGTDRGIGKQPAAEKDCRNVHALYRAWFALRPALVQSRNDPDSAERDPSWHVHDYSDGGFRHELEEPDHNVERSVGSRSRAGRD